MSVNEGDTSKEVLELDKDEDVDPLVLKCIWDNKQILKGVNNKGKQV